MKTSPLVISLLIAIVLPACSINSELRSSARLKEPHTGSCLYASKSYPLGTRKKSERSVQLENSQVKTEDDPNGVWMKCIIDESGETIWVRDKN